MSNLIGTNANQVPTCGMLGTLAFMDAANPTVVTTATGMTTLTSTATLLKITPASYGVAVTLPDATTCTLGGPLHIIDNKGAYPVRVLNSAGTLLGFIFAGVVSHVSLIDNSTAAGVWTVENSELVGPSAQLLTENLMYGIFSCIDIGSNREVLIGSNVSGGAMYAVVYDRSTNAFGLPTLVRNVSVFHRLSAVLAGSDKVLVVSNNSGTSFEAVVLSISGTTITVNTAATATMSAVLSAFADGCGLIAVGSSFVCSYTVDTPAAQIRALSISGTTVTIGSASVLDGTAGGLIALGDSTHVIAASTATTHLYTKPYLVSGSTLTAGTGTDTNSGTMTLNKLAALGTRWFVGYNDGGSTVKGGVVSLNATGNGTTTISAATLFAAGTMQDAIIVGSDKVLVLNNQTTSYANILTDAAGTASAGTAITLSAGTSRAVAYVDGTDVYVFDQPAATNYSLAKIDCSSASPVMTSLMRFGDNSYVVPAPGYPSNSVLSRSANLVYGTKFVQSLLIQTLVYQVRVTEGTVAVIPRKGMGYDSATFYRGKSDSERWNADGSTKITKLECVA